MPVRPEERRDRIRERTSGGAHRLVVVEEGEGIAGWARNSPFRPRASNATTVEASGRGLGTHRYSFLFEGSAEEGIERTVAGIALPDPASRALHERFGFRPAGIVTRVGGKLGRYRDVLWTERAMRSPGPVPGRGAGSSEGGAPKRPPSRRGNL